MSKINKHIPNEETEGNDFPKNHPFNPDNDYFLDFENRLSGSISNLEEIIHEAPVLSGIPKYNPFEVPAGYFDQLPSVIQNKIIARNENGSLLDWLILMIKPRFAIPVLSVILFAVVGINLVEKNAEQPIVNQMEELTLEDHLCFIDETTIMEDLTASSDEVLAENDESIEDYLLENNIEETTLNNEL